MPRILVNRFDDGMKNDPRDPAENACRVCTNFDTLTNPRKLTPYRDSESGDSSASTQKIQNFAIALRTGSTYSFYGLGVTSGTGRAEIYYKDLTTGGSNDLDDATWTETANNANSGGATTFNVFVYYKKVGLIFGDNGSTTLWAYDPSGSVAFEVTAVSISFTTTAQGLVHSKDDVLYVPYDNKIAKKAGGTGATDNWTAAALTLPTHLYITSICEYGNYLAIAAAPLSGIGKSIVYLWDRDSSLTTLSESIDWGEGVLKVLEETEGVLIGISISGGNSTRFKDRILYKTWMGSGPRAKLKEQFEGTSAVLPIAKQKINNRVFFMLTMTINGTLREGTWSMGINADGGVSIVQERTPNNDTALTGGVLKNFSFVGDYLFQSYIDNSANAMSKTNDQASYSITAFRESLINPGMPEGDRCMKKKLKSVGAMYEALPAAGQAVVKAKVDGGSFQTWFTETTDSQVRTEPVGVQADGLYTTSTGTELEFRLESTGGAEITGFFYEYEVILSN